jgi:hypothetical protein
MGTSKNPYRTPLPRILPRFFGKKPQNTTSIPAFSRERAERESLILCVAYESRQTSRQIRTTGVLEVPKW